jgi:hypothetical protein
MLNKKKRYKVWCGYNGEVPEEFLGQKRFRCPECGRRLQVFYQCAFESWLSEFSTYNNKPIKEACLSIPKISKHKKEV